MALHLGKYAVYGELYNTRRNSVHGWIGLLGLVPDDDHRLTGDVYPGIVVVVFPLSRDAEADDQSGTDGSGKTSGHLQSMAPVDIKSA